MNRIARFSTPLLVAALALTGCSSGSLLESKKIDYKSAKQVSPLEIPPDLTAPERDDRYLVPDASPRGVATFSAYSSERSQPQASASVAVAADMPGMKIERAGTQRWLVMPGTPDSVWQDIKDFWIETGFIINIDNPQLGVMETDWAEDRSKIPDDVIRRTLGRVLDGLYSTSLRDKFRTRVEAGSAPGTVEVFISHRGVEEVYAGRQEETTVWQPRDADPELEAEMLRRLMVRFGVQEQRAAEIVATVPQTERARLVTAADGGVALAVDESFDRAWRRVGLALDRIGFTVEDRDRSQGVYFVRYIDPDRDANSDASPGMLSRLAFWRSKDSAQAGGSEYRIRVQGAEATTVSVLSEAGIPDNSETAKRMLGLLQEQLR